MWNSFLQQEPALSSTGSEITGMLYALREAIPVMNLLQEMQEKGYLIDSISLKHIVKDLQVTAMQLRPRRKILPCKIFYQILHIAISSPTSRTSNKGYFQFISLPHV